MDLYQIAIASARNCLWIEAVSVFSRSTLINVLCVCVLLCVCVFVAAPACCLLPAVVLQLDLHMLLLFFFRCGDAFVAMDWGTTRVEHFSLSCCCLFFLCIALLFSLIVFCLFLLCSVLLRFVCFMFGVVYVILLMFD